MELKTHRLRSSEKCTYVNTLNYMHTGTSHLLSIYWIPKIAFRIQRILPLDLDGARWSQSTPPPPPKSVCLRSVLISYSQGRLSLYSIFHCRCVHIVLRPKSCLHFLKLVVLSGIGIRHCRTPNQSSLFLNKQVSIVTRKLTAGIMALSLLQFHCWTDQTQIFIAGGFHF